MKLSTSILVLGLSLSAAFATLPAHAAPVFASAGQTFYQSTGCSPHSDNLTLTVTAQDLTLVRSTPMGTTKTLVLTLDNNVITSYFTVYDGPASKPHETSSTWSPDQPTEFLAVLATLKAGVVQIKTTNGCFPDRPILNDVVDYLNDLTLQVQKV
jgi:hypothetical protein